jgi:hypothetical protein
MAAELIVNLLIPPVLTPMELVPFLCKPVFTSDAKAIDGVTEDPSAKNPLVSI